jgi:hypothetical protein
MKFNLNFTAYNRNFNKKDYHSKLYEIKDLSDKLSKLFHISISYNEIEENIEYLCDGTTYARNINYLLEIDGRYNYELIKQILALTDWIKQEENSRALKSLEVNLKIEG